MKLKNYLFTGLITALLGACNSGATSENTNATPAQESAKMDYDAIKAYVIAMEDTLSMAYKEKSVELFEKFYARDAVTYGEGRDQLFGRKEIVSHFKRSIASDTINDYNFKYITIDVFAAGDLAVENGKWVEYDSTNTETAHGFYTVVFQKQEDGRYRSIRDMWNNSTLDH